MTKMSVLVALVALGLSMASSTASYAANGNGSSGQENRNERAVAALQAASNGPTHTQSQLGEQQAVAGVLGLNVTEATVAFSQGSGVSDGTVKPSVCALTAVGHHAPNC